MATVLELADRFHADTDRVEAVLNAIGYSWAKGGRAALPVLPDGSVHRDALPRVEQALSRDC